MALTFAKLAPNPDHVSGNVKVRYRKVTFDSSYPTGGEAVTAADFGLRLLYTVEICGGVAQKSDESLAFAVGYDETAKKLVGVQTAAWDQQERDRVRREQQAADAERRRLEDEERLRAATRLEAQGKPAAAEAALTAPVTTPIFTPPVRQVEKADGLSFRDNWKAQVTDLMALVQAVVEGKASLACLEPNMVTLNGLARSLKDEMRVPGVEARNERISAVKA